MVGAGQASLLLGCDLLGRGHEVSIYTDRTAEQVLAQPVALPRFMYMRAVDYERAMGLSFWDDEDSWFRAMRVEFLLGPGRPVSMESPLDGQAIDQRRKYARWMQEFERRGGRLEIAEVGVADLEELASRFDAVFVTTGKTSLLAELFERDDERSEYPEPARKHVVLTVRKLRQSPRRIIMTFTDADGEIFRVPFVSQDGEQCHNVLFEARPGRRFDRFDDVSDPDELTRRAKEVFLEFAPWEEERLRDFELVSPDAWTRFAVQPVVRRPVGRLPSGRPVFGLGDAVMVIDPVAGQGANLASRMAKLFAQRIADLGEGSIDGPWMQEGFDEFWESDARFVFAQTRTILEPTKPYKETMLAATIVPEISRDFFESLNRASILWPWIDDMDAVKDYITRTSGRKWWRVAAAARAKVVRQEIGRRLPRRSRAPVEQPALP